MTATNITRPGRSAINPIEFEILKNLFVSIAEEMGVTLCRTSFSPNIKERLDYSCAIYDADGETIAQGDHMPVHLGAMPLSVRAAIDSVRMTPGDMVILNDPFRGGTHLPDITLVSPVFLDAAASGEPAEPAEPAEPDGAADEERWPPGHANQQSAPAGPLASRAPARSARGHAAAARPAFYVANRAHHSDVGGMSPGSMPLAREVYQEGLIIPPLRIVEQGTIRQDVLSLILANVRTPDEREGDLTAQIASNRVGEARLRDIVAKYGAARIGAYAASAQDYTERVLRETIAAIPDGTYRYEDVLDDDGFRTRRIRIAVAITIDGTQATVDFSGADPQTEGSINANFAITLSATLYAFRCLVRDDVLYNAGVSRPVTVIAPEGTIVNARRPSAVAGGNVETSQRITDVVLGALARALPDRIPAASQGTMNNITLGGRDPRTGRGFAYYETLGGGMGGRNGLAGISGVHTHMSNTRNTPVEALEHYLPVRIRRYGLRQGSGGAGRYPGGEGLVREYEMLTDTEVTVLSERRESQPYGAQGGEPGGVGRNTLIRGGIETPLPAKARLHLETGDRLRIETPGGGGFGKAGDSADPPPE